MNPLCIRELAELIGGELRFGCMPPLGGEYEPLGRVRLCAAEVQPGDLFWALESSQGNTAFRAEEAFSRGALGAVVSARNLEPWAGKFSLRVGNSRAALWQLAKAMRRRFTGKLVAVAHADGNRGVYRAIESMLHGGANRPPAADPADQDAAVALQLVELPERERVETIELPLDACTLGRFALLAAPHVAAFAGNGTPPLLGDANALAPALLSLLDALPQGAYAVADGDDFNLREALRRETPSVVWYGSGPHCDVYATEIEWRCGGLALVVDGQSICMPACGRGQVSAALAAYATGRLLNISPRRIAAALGRFRPAQETLSAVFEEYAIST